MWQWHSRYAMLPVYRGVDRHFSEIGVVEDIELTVHILRSTSGKPSILRIP
jgi:hypothetical protein